MAFSFFHFQKRKTQKKLLFLLIVFLFAFSIRLWNLYAIGRTVDEPAYINPGFQFVRLALKGDFHNPAWYDSFDHPPLARYIYGVASQFDFTGYDKQGNPTFNYDNTVARFVSAFISSLSVVVVALICLEFFSFFVTVSSSMIFATLPFFVGMSQRVTLESPIMLLFTAGVYTFLLLLDRPYKKKWLIITGIISGLAVLVKQSNGLLFPLFILIYITWYFFKRPKENFFTNKKALSLIFIPMIAALTFFVLWPMPFFHLPEVLAFHNKLWLNQLPIPEVFFGRLVLVPKIYYIVYFFITTPVLILLLFTLGLRKIDHKPDWRGIAMILWFLIPFSLSFFSVRQHAVRYIIEIYAPLAVLASLGLESLFVRFKQNKLRYGVLALVFFYMMFNLAKITPYYFDYFNELIGGPKLVYQKKLFQLGWWGEGTKEAVDSVAAHAKKGSTVALFDNKIIYAPHRPNIKLEVYSDRNSYDYVVDHYYNTLREGYDDSKIVKNYKLVYSVMANGAPIVKVYKKK